MDRVSRAIHIRTGSREAADAIDAWLNRHDVATLSLTNVYDACVYLLRKYDMIADLAFVGTDWLAAEDFAILDYLRQTWPRVGIVVYGCTANTPRVDVLPLMRALPAGDLTRQLSENTPTEMLARLYARATPLGEPPPAREKPAQTAIPTPRPAAPRVDTPPPAVQRAEPPDDDLRTILTAEELAELLDRPEQSP